MGSLVYPVPDATTSAKGKIQLAGVLSGTAAVPTFSTTTGAWATWAPTLTNISGGTLNYAKYFQIGKTVHFRLKYTLAGAGVSGLITFTPPVTMSADYAATDTLNATTMFYDVSVTTPYQGNAFTATTTSITLKCLHTDGTRGNNEATSSTNPFTFASGDIVYCSGILEAA
jgi:hypothetical protein